MPEATQNAKTQTNIRENTAQDARSNTKCQNENQYVKRNTRRQNQHKMPKSKTNTSNSTHSAKNKKTRTKNSAAVQSKAIQNYHAKTHKIRPGKPMHNIAIPYVTQKFCTK
jgi:hypothetical protein